MFNLPAPLKLDWVCPGSCKYQDLTIIWSCVSFYSIFYFALCNTVYLTCIDIARGQIFTWSSQDCLLSSWGIFPSLRSSSLPWFTIVISLGTFFRLTWFFFTWTFASWESEGGSCHLFYSFECEAETESLSNLNMFFKHTCDWSQSFNSVRAKSLSCWKSENPSLCLC